jgi:carbohydrate kinase (thermoresistant glucokinase family)
MGVSACGKSSFGREFAGLISAPFLEGDEFHPLESISKMRAGIALEDADRWPWLDGLADALKREALLRGSAVGSCSALKRSYRDQLRRRIGMPVAFVYLRVPVDELARRILARTGHYMPVSLLNSQWEALEPPIDEEGTITLDATEPLPVMIGRAASALGVSQATAPGSSVPAK